jgi:hypothetical protein
MRRPVRYPPLASCAFGLLHGFGFAAALREVGLPTHELAVALLCFNLGVEVGQIVFIVAVLALLVPVACAAGRISWVAALRVRPAIGWGYALACRLRSGSSSGWGALETRRGKPGTPRVCPEPGRREWDRTTDHHHVKVMLYH